MASTEIENFDPTATVDNINKIAADRALNRRRFLSTLGMASAAAGATALMSGCTNASTSNVAVNTSGVAQTNILNFVLNLQYLEATFYSYLTTGTDISSATGVNLSNSGAITGAPAALTVAAPITQQLTLRSVDSPGTVPYVAEMRTLQQINATDAIAYLRIRPPLISDRDSIMVVRTQHGAQSHGTIWTKWRAAPGYPSNRGIVRMDMNQGSWTFEPLAGGLRTRITYRAITQPGGAIPRWLAASSTVNAVPRLFKALRDKAHESKRAL